MNGLSERIRAARADLGISQANLTRLAEVSLATVQNLEAGRANPSLATLERIMRALGLRLDVHAESADWDALAGHGLPLKGRQALRQRPTLDGLLHHLRLALREVEDDRCGDSAERKREAVVALLLAIRAAFPTIFRTRLRKSRFLEHVLPDEPSGRMIKLKRIAESALVEYL